MLDPDAFKIEGSRNPGIANSIKRVRRAQLTGWRIFSPAHSGSGAFREPSSGAATILGHSTVLIPGPGLTIPPAPGVRGRTEGAGN
jgi:hypothetical protein